MKGAQAKVAGRGFLVAVALICLLVFAVCVGGKIRNTVSDPQGTLLVSQAIVQHGTIKLDAYQQYFPRYSNKIHPKNGHFYYYFPLGSSLFSVPFVAVANFFGFDMLDFENQLQMAIVALISIGTFLLLVAFAKLFLPAGRSLLAATAFWFGTAFASTGATGLWSHDFATFFALAAIYLTFREHWCDDRLRFFVVGFLLFAAYFCRPTFLLLIALYFPSLFLLDRRRAFWAALSCSIFLALFSGFSYFEYGQLLPDYYLPSRLAGNQFWTALYGNVASPARGLLVYSPFLLAPLAWVLCGGAKRYRFRLEYVFLIWAVLHLCAISRFPHWWAGYSFGPRLMFDVLPAFYLWFVLYLRSLTSVNTWQWRFLIIAIAFSAMVNTGQGLFNRSTAAWNGNPSVDQYPQYLFDWKYPQFLNTGSRQRDRLKEHERKLAAGELESNAGIQ